MESFELWLIFEENILQQKLIQGKDLSETFQDQLIFVMCKEGQKSLPPSSHYTKHKSQRNGSKPLGC